MFFSFKTVQQLNFSEGAPEWFFPDGTVARLSNQSKIIELSAPSRFYEYLDAGHRKPNSISRFIDVIEVLDEPGVEDEVLASVTANLDDKLHAIIEADLVADQAEFEQELMVEELAGNPSTIRAIEGKKVYVFFNTYVEILRLVSIAGVPTTKVWC